MERKGMRLWSKIVIAYMLIAFAWWSVLLFTKNRDAFHAKSEYLQLIMAAEGHIESREEYLASPGYQELYNKYQRQEWMIFGEATLFIISLILGIWMISRGYRREMEVVRNGRNFLLSITHELKSPLASIKLILETFRKRSLPKEQLDQFSSNGIAEVERLNDLVNNILLAAKMETAYNPTMEDLDLNELLAEIADRMSRKFPRDHISFETKLGPHFFKADSFGIDSITTNLIENSIKYSPSPSQIKLALSMQRDKVVLQVSDFGFGIPHHERKRIFDRFYRIGDEQRRKTKGTGLGLYIVDNIVRAHGGRIAIQDNEPQGTIVEISFPKNRIRAREVKHQLA